LIADGEHLVGFAGHMRPVMATTKMVVTAASAESKPLYSNR